MNLMHTKSPGQTFSLWCMRWTRSNFLWILSLCSLSIVRSPSSSSGKVWNGSWFCPWFLCEWLNSLLEPQGIMMQLSTCYKKASPSCRTTALGFTRNNDRIERMHQKRQKSVDVMFKEYVENEDEKSGPLFQWCWHKKEIWGDGHPTTRTRCMVVPGSVIALDSSQCQWNNEAFCQNC